MLPAALAALARGVADLLFPDACLVCDAPRAVGAAFRHGFCSTCCRSLVEDVAECCPYCAATIGPHTDTSNGCSACRTRGFPFAAAVRLGRYDATLKTAILATKNAGGEPVAEMLGRLFAEERSVRLKELAATQVVPVPLHWRRRWGRGYNQAAAIGREIAAALGVPFRPNWLVRTRPAAQHAQPSAAARIENVKGAFRPGQRASFAGATVLVVDDVMTTGSTAAEAARVATAAGAARVGIAVLARA